MAEPATPIRKFRGKHAFLSNFYQGAPFEWRGHTWATAEHAYQAAKCERTEDARAIREATSPASAKRMGRRVLLRPDFDEVKIDLMREILQAKFSHHSTARLLENTGHAELIEENHWGDTFWGRCDGRGLNHLGNLLMGVKDRNRRRLREAEKSSNYRDTPQIDDLDSPQECLFR